MPESPPGTTFPVWPAVTGLTAASRSGFVAQQPFLARQPLVVAAEAGADQRLAVGEHAQRADRGADNRRRDGVRWHGYSCQVAARRTAGITDGPGGSARAAQRWRAA